MSLYKYMSAAGFNKMFAKKEPSLMYRRIDKLNDPYENLIGLDDYAKSVFDWVNIPENLATLNGFDFMANLSAGFLQIKAHTDMSAVFRESLFVLSLSRTYKNLLMWAHYADMHKGIVVELDIDSPVYPRNNAVLKDITSIEYSSHRNIPKFLPPTNYQELLPSIYFTAMESIQNKSIDWCYEEEERQVFTDTRPLHRAMFNSEQKLSDIPNSLYLEKEFAWLVPIGYELIRCVYLGARFDENDSANRNTINRLKAKSVSIRRMELDTNEYALHEI